MGVVTPENEQWTLVKAALSLPRPLGTLSIVFGLFALAGYLGQIEVMYRPFHGGPATHPLTALSLLFLGSGVRANYRTLSGLLLGRLVVFSAILIAVLRLAETRYGGDLTTWVTPFHEQVELDLRLGKNNGMGVNTAWMMLSIAAALVFYGSRLPLVSQLLAFVAIAIPTVSFIGYAYGLEHFYGQMSLLTASAGFVLAIAVLTLTADQGGLKAILSPFVGGKIARVQVLVGYIVPVWLGFILVNSMLNGSEQGQNMFGIFVVAICWFITLMVSTSAIFLEKVDFDRRQGEAKLAATARSDPLTGLPNRRHFFESALREMERTKRSGNELWVMMIDLDRFKNINDMAGHAVGDAVLIAVAKKLSESIRKVDLAGRLGGEEFAVAVTNSPREGCARVAENIRRGIESIQIPGWTDIHGPVTTSIGCARIKTESTLEEALNDADKALYRSKVNGRNQVSFHRT